jgi:hypothetical protein
MAEAPAAGVLLDAAALPEVTMVVAERVILRPALVAQMLRLDAHDSVVTAASGL